MKTRTLGLLLITSIFMSNDVFANLIINGSFEDNDVKTNSWRWFTADRVNGWQGSNVEIWDDFLSVKAIDGTQFAELNAHGQRKQPFSIYQTFDTQVGNLYDLSFYYRARHSEKEAFRVDIEDINSQILFTQIVDDHIRGEWFRFNTQFLAATSQTTLTFSSVWPHARTVGNLLDDIRVIGVQSRFRVHEASEPSSILLLLLSAGAIVFLRKKR